MSTTVNLICSICSVEYGNSDEIISTYCGHLFHNCCFQNWLARSATCPDCRSENTQNHRVYLNLEAIAARRMPPEVQEKLENEISKLEQQLQESENNFMKLQEATSLKEEEILELKNEIECKNVQASSLEEEFTKLNITLQESEKNFLDLLEQTHKTDESLKEKEIEINCLKLQNESKEQKFQELKVEHEATKSELSATEKNHLMLKDKLTVSEAEIIKLMNGLKMQVNDDNGDVSEYDTFVAVEISLNQTIRTLKEKLHQTTLELDKEIGFSTALTAENMKLRKVLTLKSPNEDDRILAIRSLPDSRKNQSM